MGAGEHTPTTQTVTHTQRERENTDSTHIVCAGGAKEHVAQCQRVNGADRQQTEVWKFSTPPQTVMVWRLIARLSTHAVCAGGGANGHTVQLATSECQMVKGGKCRRTWSKGHYPRVTGRCQRAASEAVSGRGNHRQNRQHSRGMGISSTPPQTVLVWLSG